MTGVTGTVVCEKEGALMETDGEEVEFSGIDRILRLESCEQAVSAGAADAGESADSGAGDPKPSGSWLRMFRDVESPCLVDHVHHLIQDESLVERIHEEEIPPEEYYLELGKVLKSKHPKAARKVVAHVVALVSAFDTATAFALSFGIAKFQLAQQQVKLVGELVGTFGRRPNPELIRAIKAWPEINDLKDLQSFLGTANYVRPHAGPAYVRVMSPLRAQLKPGAEWPLSQE